jgi:hypothetical protein
MNGRLRALHGAGCDPPPRQRLSYRVSLAEGVPAAGQRHAPVLVERAGGDLDPRRSGAADSLGFVDAAHHFGDHDRVKTGVNAP